MEERKKLIKRIAGKGGIYGIAAKHFISNDHLSNELLKETHEYLDTKSLKELWGKKLINDVMMFNVKHNGKDVIR